MHGRAEQEPRGSEARSGFCNTTEPLGPLTASIKVYCFSAFYSVSIYREPFARPWSSHICDLQGVLLIHEDCSPLSQVQFVHSIQFFITRFFFSFFRLHGTPALCWASGSCREDGGHEGVSVVVRVGEQLLHVGMRGADAGCLSGYRQSYPTRVVLYSVSRSWGSFRNWK